MARTSRKGKTLNNLQALESVAESMEVVETPITSVEVVKSAFAGLSNIKTFKPETVKTEKSAHDKLFSAYKSFKKLVGKSESDFPTLKGIARFGEITTDSGLLSYMVGNVEDTTSFLLINSRATSLIALAHSAIGDLPEDLRKSDIGDRRFSSYAEIIRMAENYITLADLHIANSSETVKRAKSKAESIATSTVARVEIIKETRESNRKAMQARFNEAREKAESKLVEQKEKLAHALGMKQLSTSDLAVEVKKLKRMVAGLELLGQFAESSCKLYPNEAVAFKLTYALSTDSKKSQTDFYSERAFSEALPNEKSAGNGFVAGYDSVLIETLVDDLHESKRLYLLDNGQLRTK